jgi:S-adenosylmethionine:tRNA ribosyltransferase-isomerase
MDLAAFDYDLPEELIAQEPLADRAAARMLVLHRAEQRWEDRQFRELPTFLLAGDCLVLNDSRVFPARLFGRRAGVHSLPIGKKNPKRREYLSGAVEVFLLRAASADGKEWLALVRPGRKVRVGERIIFGPRPDEGPRPRERNVSAASQETPAPSSSKQEVEAEVIRRGEFGERAIRFHTSRDPFEIFDRIGHMPLPPYIKRADRPMDRERYQTVFARETGSAAAPTAGLHFTPEMLGECCASGAEVAYVTLHIGLGTFQPLRAGSIETARLHEESYRITEENAAKMRAAKRLVAVGTTSMRAIESALLQGEIRARQGETDLFIYPGFRFRGAGALLTNFHLPRTSLLLLVCAFGGTEFVLAAYRHAVEQRYRFYSYGDCMLIV